jgi:hypothetical protein
VSPKREATATFIAIAIGATGTLAVVYANRWYYGTACILLLLAWIATATGTPGNDPPKGDGKKDSHPSDDGPWTDHVSTAGLSGTSWMP